MRTHFRVAALAARFARHRGRLGNGAPQHGVDAALALPKRGIDDDIDGERRRRAHSIWVETGMRSSVLWWSYFLRKTGAHFSGKYSPWRSAHSLLSRVRALSAARS